MILLDTTILVYAVGDQHPLREPCRRVLAAHADGRIEASTTVEAIQEFVHVRARRRTRDDAVALARSFAQAFDLLVFTPDDLDLGLSLFVRHPNLGAFDALLAGAALNHGAEALISADRAFAAIPGIRWIDPTGSGLGEIL